METFEMIYSGISALFFTAVILLLIVAMARGLYKRYHKPDKWMHTVATMTGKTNLVSTGRKGYDAKTYTEYEISYSAQGGIYVKFFNMYPGPDLGDAYGEGVRVQIRYEAKNPGNFEVLEILDDY